MGIKTYERMEVTSNLDAAIALARTLYDMEEHRIFEANMTPGIPAFAEVADVVWRECYLTLNDAARTIGYELDPICDVVGTYHYVEVSDFLSGVSVGVWDGREWFRF